MSDIRIYNLANMPTSPLTGDVVLCTDEFNGALANSVHLCTNATGPVWKSFENDSAVTPPPIDAWSTSYSSSSGQFLDLSAARSVFDSASQFSISAWFKYTSFSSKGVIWATGSGNNLAGMWYNSGNLLFTVRNGGAHNIYATRSAPSLNTWAHMVCVFNSGQGTLYVTPTDTGVTTSSTVDFVYSGSPVSTTNAAGGAGLRVGIFSHALVQGFEGNINDVAVWGSALSSSDVATIYDSGKPTDISTLNPYGWWRMGDDENDSPVDGVSAASITDSSGNGYTATQATASRQPTFSTDVPS